MFLGILLKKSNVDDVESIRHDTLLGTLHYGDNLDIMRQDIIKDESVDLIYLDPPFNSKRAYNILYQTAQLSGGGG